MAATHILVYPTTDLQRSKELFASLLGTEPYADAPYYVGFRTGDQEIGLDPHGTSSGPIAYWATEDIAATTAELTAAGWQVVSEARDVGGGMMVAQLGDGSGSTIGLRQSPK